MSSVKQQGQGRIFKNPLLEALTKSHPVVILLEMGTFMGVSFYLYSIFGQEISWWSMVLIFLSGLLFWTFAEYCIHRYVFHFINDQPWSHRFQYIMHGVHHEYPNDLPRIIMPPVPAFLISALFFIIFFAIMRTYAFLFFPGFILGYLFYVGIHYSIHRFRAPKMLKHLWVNHTLHHHQYPDKGFGVSNLFWDRIFGTLPPMEKRKRSNVVVKGSQ